MTSLIPAAASPPGVRPIRETFGALLRLAPFVAVFVVAVTVGSYVITNSGNSEEFDATSRVGLTSDVIWPYYDATRERAVAIVEDPATQQLVESELADGGGRILRLSADVPPGQAYFDVVATATTDDLAVAAADTVVRILIERSTDTVAAAAQRNADEAASVLAELDARIAEIDDRLIEIDRGITAAIEAESDAELLRIERNGLGRERSEMMARRGAGQAELASYEARVANSRSELSIVYGASPQDASGDSDTPIVIAAAVGALIFGFAAALAWDRSRGRLVSRWQAEQLAQVPVIGELSDGPEEDPSLSALLSRLMSLEESGIIALAAANGSQSSELGGPLGEFAARSGLRVAIVEPRADGGSSGDYASSIEGVADLAVPAGGMLTRLTIPPDVDFATLASTRVDLHRFADQADLVLVEMTGDDPASEYAVGLADSAVIVSTLKRDRISDLVAAASTLRARGLTVRGAVLRPTRRRSR